MSENFSNLAIDINLQVKKAEQTPTRIYLKKSTPGDIIVKFLKLKMKKNS